jgi:hypothetical protein
MMEPGAERLPELSKCSLPPVPLRHDSRSEFALCELFKRYIPGWVPVMGNTFQVPIRDKRIDFLIGKTFVEFHPILVIRELKDSDATALFRQMYKRGNHFEKQQLAELLTLELRAQYSARRWQLIQHSEHRGKELIVCGNEVDIYKNIVNRFSKEPPGLKVFCREFSELIEACKL